MEKEIKTNNIMSVDVTEADTKYFFGKKDRIKTLNSLHIAMPQEAAKHMHKSTNFYYCQQHKHTQNIKIIDLDISLPNIQTAK